MNNLIWLIRASRWSRKPPSPRRVALVLTVIALCLLIVGLEYVGWRPDWARMERPRGMHLPQP